MIILRISLFIFSREFVITNHNTIDSDNQFDKQLLLSFICLPAIFCILTWFPHEIVFVRDATAFFGQFEDFFAEVYQTV